MDSIIIHKPHLVTKMQIWAPRYKDKTADGKDSYVVLLSQHTVAHASPVVIIEFTKAKHLQGQRYCIRKDKAMRYPVDSNGKIPCYAIPLDDFSTWQTAAEVRDIALNLWEDERERVYDD